MGSFYYLLLHFQKPIKNPSLLDSDIVIIVTHTLCEIFQVHTYYRHIYDLKSIKSG